MDEWLCSSTHNKDNVKALDKCAPLARFISFVPFYNLWYKTGSATNNVGYICLLSS